jgi:hypothetical protein
MSDTISEVADATQNAVVGHRPHAVHAPVLGPGPAAAGSGSGPEPPAHAWQPGCHAVERAAAQLRAPEPFPANTTTLPHPVLESRPFAPAQAGSRQTRRIVKLLAPPEQKTATTCAAPAATSADRLFMGIVIAVLVVANCVAIGSALTQSGGSL